MEITILVPHYRAGKMTAYCVSQLLAMKGKHKQRIIVIDNSDGEGLEYLEGFRKRIKVLSYPKNKLQSHGIAFDFAMEEVKTDHFITVESDSFPTQPDWLDYYEGLQDYDAAGSLLKLSGGTYLHPAGAMYRTSVYKEAAEVKYPFHYFPNMIVKHSFPYHVMWPKATPIDLTGFTLHHSYDNGEIQERAEHYLPVTGVFHNGMGYKDDHISTYGNRTAETESGSLLNGDKTTAYLRVGYEPGQWFHYYMVATGKKIHHIPTDIKWMQGRENQQQEYTMNEGGFKHLWGVSAYFQAKAPGLEDVVKFKEKQMDDLFNNL